MCFAIHYQSSSVVLPSRSQLHSLLASPFGFLVAKQEACLSHPIMPRHPCPLHRIFVIQVPSCHREPSTTIELGIITVTLASSSASTAKAFFSLLLCLSPVENGKTHKGALILHMCLPPSEDCWNAAHPRACVYHVQDNLKTFAPTMLHQHALHLRLGPWLSKPIWLCCRMSAVLEGPATVHWRMWW